MRPYLERKQTELQEDESKALNPQSKPETLGRLYEKYKNTPDKNWIIYTLFINKSFPIEIIKFFIYKDHKTINRSFADKRTLFKGISIYQANRLSKNDLEKVNKYTAFSYKYWDSCQALERILERIENER